MGNTAETDSGQLFKILPDGEGIPAPNQAFDRVLAEHGFGQLTRSEVSTLQINVGKRCNQACHHCHVDAGPKRSEMMREEVAARVLELLAASPSIRTVDITGGAPELNPNFRWLVIGSCKAGREVIDRCNLTVLVEPGMEDMAEFLAGNGVQIVASLPCYTKENVDAQRGRGVFEKSIRALRSLNALGYGKPDSALGLDLVYNPLGPNIPAHQGRLEADYKNQLRERFGVEFHRLFTITNMPISRFAESLHRNRTFAAYSDMLIEKFNPSTVAEVMCRSLISVGWDGRLYDCDFNQMLEIGLQPLRRSVWDVESFHQLAGQRISTGVHCFGCTAGAGSSCGGALQ